MGTATKTLYDTDFAEWASHTARLLRAGRMLEVDLEHVAEEIEDLGKSERSAIESQLRRLLLHKLKQLIQPERDGVSWRVSIVDARREIRDRIAASPSLRPHLQQNLQKVYQDAVELAVTETEVEHAEIPEKCPWTIDALLHR